MRPKLCEQATKALQLELDDTLLKNFINLNHPLVKLAEAIDWDRFDLYFGEQFQSKRGRPALPTRLIVGLHYLKHMENLSDEEVVARLTENPYWQYFCGFEVFQKRPPCDATTLVKWRKKFKDEGAERLLQESLATAHSLGLLKASQVQEVYVDTTVQEKNVTYPTDAKLLVKVRGKLVKLGKKHGVRFKQTFEAECKDLAFQISRYAHARQFKRMHMKMKVLKRRVAKIYHMVMSQVPKNSRTEELHRFLNLAHRILFPLPGKKVYSLHEPQVECISKGKARVRYEFGNRVGIAVTAQGNWVVGALGFHGNPYDGSTLKETLEQVKRITGVSTQLVGVDKGYRGQVHHPEGVKVLISGRKRLPELLKRFLNSRSKIEPVIGHLKSDHRMRRNYLAGILGDKINPILAAAAFNLRKVMRSFFLSFFIRWILTQIHRQNRLVWVAS